jgi:hypothetical protein
MLRKVFPRLRGLGLARSRWADRPDPGRTRPQHQVRPKCCHPAASWRATDIVLPRLLSMSRHRGPASRCRGSNLEGMGDQSLHAQSMGGRYFGCGSGASLRGLQVEPWRSRCKRFSADFRSTCQRTGGRCARTTRWARQSGPSESASAVRVKPDPASGSRIDRPRVRVRRILPACATDWGRAVPRGCGRPPPPTPGRHPRARADRSAVIENFSGAAWTIGADHRATARHGLDQHVAEALMRGGHGQDRRPRHV